MNINIGDVYITGVHDSCQYTMKSVKHDVCDPFRRTYFFIINEEFIKSLRRV